MSLREARCRFGAMLPRLLDYATYTLGFEVAPGEVMRGPVQAEVNALSQEEKSRLAALIREEFPRLAKLVADAGKGTRTSLHLDGLALDLNLYRNGVYLGQTTHHAELGRYWESIGGAWGGGWGDGNHYSLAYGGKK